MKFIIEGLSKRYDHKQVLNNISFEFEPGKIYALLGCNGAGKTTLFNCINNDIRRDGGAFYIEDESGNRSEPKPDDIGYVVSTPTVPEFLTGREFLKFFVDINSYRIPNPEPLDNYFEAVSLSPEDRDRLLKDYSHGMKNKMQMLINTICPPRVLLLDEPLTSLDVVVSEEIKKMLKNMRGDHVIIFSTHILELALDLCDEIVILSRGVLETVDKSNLDNADFKQKIIDTLKEGMEPYGASNDTDGSSNTNAGV